MSEQNKSKCNNLNSSKSDEKPTEKDSSERPKLISVKMGDSKPVPPSNKK